MVHLNFSQKCLLKKIKRVGVFDCTSIDEKTLSIVRFLRSNNLLDTKVTRHIFPSQAGIQSVEGQILSAQISEAGKAYLSEAHKENYRWRISLSISIFAAIGAYREELAAILQAITKLLR